MGAVFEAEDEKLGRRVAVKVLTPTLIQGSQGAARFLREVRALAAIEHEHVVPIYEAGEEGGIEYLVMPLLKGESLAARLKREPVPPLALVLKVGREVALGLAAAHEKGLVHRDVKPSNIWLEGDPAAPEPAEQVRRIRVLDFGLVRGADRTDELTSNLTSTGMMLGTPAYMSPEQARGPGVDARADLFSLGAVLYQMVTGRQPFTGPSLFDVLTTIATQDPPPAAELNPAVPWGLSDLIERLLAKDPSRRPASAREVIEALAAVETEPARSRRRSRRSRWRQWKDLPTLGMRRRGRWSRWWVLAGGVLLMWYAVALVARLLFH
jgi:serine/threonine protein kinase